MTRFTCNALASLFIAACAAVPCAFTDEDDHTIRPGVGLGDLKLGMTREAARKVIENIDGSYKLPTGENVDYAVWHDKPQDSTIRLIFSKQNKLVQINSEAPVPATADGISLSSSLNEIKRKYPSTKSVSGLPQYADDRAKGIAFQFKDSSKKSLSAIIVHQPRARIVNAQSTPKK